MSFIDDLESSIDIVELVKRYTNLKKAGVNYKAKCPFPGHDEKTPSFIVSPSKQIAHCFGCNRGGGPIKFIMDIENCDFKEAVEILSSITGVKVKGFSFEENIKRKNIYGIFKDIKNYYKKALKNNPLILKYLFDRGLKNEVIENFDFGYSDSGIELYNYLIQKGYDNNLIKDANILLDLKTKKDKFIGRIIFPIKNLRGDIIAFAGRITGSGEPKYLNSQASNIFDKSSILFGLFEARINIVKKGYAIITEGYMDVISLHQAGIINSIGVSGTALTEKHIQILKRITKIIYLCFDNDEAGTKATLQAIELLKNKEIEVRIITLKGGKDPDEIIKKGLDFNDFIKNAKTPIGYYIDKFKVSEGFLNKKELLKNLLSILKNYQDNIEVDYYLKEISIKLDIKLDIVYKEYNLTKLNKNIFIKNPVNKDTIMSEDMVIGYIIKYPEKIIFIKDNIMFYDYISDNLKLILKKGVEEINNMEIGIKNRYYAISQNDEILQIKAQIEGDLVKNDNKIEQIILKTILKFNSDTYKKAVFILKEKIKQGDLNALKEYKEILKNKL